MTWIPCSMCHQIPCSCTHRVWPQPYYPPGNAWQPTQTGWVIYTPGRLSDEDVDRIAEKVAEKLRKAPHPEAP